jgi:intracellular septation protein A
MKPRRWQDWVNVVVGVWVAISPWALGFANNQTAARTAWVLGAAIVVFAGIGIYMHEAWEEAINIILGVCLLGSPWALDFADQSTATANFAISGVLVVAFGLWAMLRDMDLMKMRDENRQAHGSR